MSQFCGSFWALSRRSLLTVILYWAASGKALSASAEALARATQANVTSLLVGLGIWLPLPRCASWRGAAVQHQRYQKSSRDGRGGQWGRVSRSPLVMIS